MNVVNAARRFSGIHLGIISPASQFQDLRLKGLVLEQVVKFDPLPYAKARRAVFDMCLVGTNTDPLLMFLLQIKDARLVWLANPAEPDVWDAVDNWKANGSVSVALSNGTTHIFNIPYRYRTDESFRALRHNIRLAVDLLTADAIALLAAGALDEYEFPGLPAPKHLTACLVYTPGVDDTLKTLGYEAKWDAQAYEFCARKSLVVLRRWYYQLHSDARRLPLLAGSHVLSIPDVWQGA